jgi:hypothetical protein
MVRSIHNTKNVSKTTHFLYFDKYCAAKINTGKIISAYLGKEEKLPEKVGIINAARE